ncbi:hypothetical protein [Gimesia algae]|uniref:Uncharacterized protein n=1 Tax=Gimesia algae TaxID=2527971 RepID=A0A517VKD4_9PLAN|nr:hypothetical protein [Gimesia algae]QDT93415.1 hypothetical protein Pan161_50940 [Gimesia algae]
MSVSRHLPDYPILLAGVSTPVVKGMREMGLSVTELQDDLTYLTGYQSSRWNLLLVGSQKCFNEQELQTLSLCRIPIIDLAEFNNKTGIGRTIPEMSKKANTGVEQFNSQFAVQLKTRIQQSGGAWIRLGDYPYPYQGVICYAESALGNDFREYSNVMSPLTVSLDLLHCKSEAEWQTESNSETQRKLRVELISRYRQGLPVSLSSVSSRLEMTQLFQDIHLDRKQMPLVWVTSLDTFFRWWKLRSEFSVSINRLSTGWETIISGNFEGFSPALQIWRSQHSATVALYRGVNEIRDDATAFANNPERHPGGFSAHWAGVCSSLIPFDFKNFAAAAAS